MLIRGKGFRRAIFCCFITLMIGVAWMRSHFRADRLQWFVGRSLWQLVSARGRIYLRYEDLGYALPHWNRVTEVIRTDPSAGTEYRSDKFHLGREIDKRFAGFEFARGADYRLNFWGYRETYGEATAGKNPFWSLQIPDWFIFVIGCLGSSHFIHRFARRRSRLQRGRCVVCDYDIRANTDRCPECGEPIPEEFPR